MTLCMTCGGTRVNNVLEHRRCCPFWRETARAATEARIGQAPPIVEHPDLVELEAQLAYWFPDVA